MWFQSWSRILTSDGTVVVFHLWYKLSVFVTIMHCLLNRPKILKEFYLQVLLVYRQHFSNHLKYTVFHSFYRVKNNTPYCWKLCMFVQEFKCNIVVFRLLDHYIYASIFVYFLWFVARFLLFESSEFWSLLQVSYVQ